MFAIVMSTYNGAAFLRAAIDSISAQSESNWQLFIRDDGSTDNTAALIEGYQQQDLRITVVKDTLGNLGAAESFSVCLDHALRSSEADLFLFCDQDDEWRGDRLSCNLDNFSNSRVKNGQSFFCVNNCALIDGQSQVVQPSYYSQKKIGGMDFFNQRFISRLLFTNVFIGCTLCFNRVLAMRYSDTRRHIAMHDWWLALVAIADGASFCFDERDTVLYRQHSANVVGINDGRLTSIAALRKRIRSRNKYSVAILKQAFDACRLYIENTSLPRPSVELKLSSLLLLLERASRLQAARILARCYLSLGVSHIRRLSAIYAVFYYLENEKWVKTID